MEKEAPVDVDQGFIIRKQSFIVKNDEKIEDVYDIGKKPLGSGSFGTVYKCVHKESGKKRAVKKVPRKKIKNMEKFKNEIKVL